MRPVDPRLLRHARAARPFLVAATLLGVAAAGLVIVQADLLAGVITRAFLGHATLAAVATPLLLLALVVLGRSAVAWLSETTAHRAAAAVIAQLRHALVDRAVRSGRSADRSPAEIATLATRGLDGLDGYFARYLPQLLLAAVVPAAVGVRILAADWLAAVIIALTVPLIPIFMILIGLYTRRDVGRQWRTLSVLANHFLDVLAGLAVLTAFGRAREQATTIRRITERYRRQTMRTLGVAFLSALALELLATLSVAVVAVSIGLRLVSGHIDLHTALVILILAPEVYLPLRAVGARFHDSAEGLAAADEALAILDTDDDHTGRVPAPDPSRVPLRLRDVTVTGRSGPILAGVSAEIPAGRVLGVVGPSGAGKTTLLDLLLAWRTPDGGEVTVGGVDLRDLDRAAWLARIAWVPQHPCLVAGTVADNLRLGRPDATPDELREVADVVALDVPLDRRVGELGAGLSTGQRRRVALARALLLDRPLLLLDEPTEGVDADTEHAILTALPAVLAGRTAVIVTHRPAVLDLCDSVLTLATPTTHTPIEPVNVTRQADRQATPAPEPPTTAATPGQQGALRWLAGVVRPYRTRLVLAGLAGAAALASGIALTATSAWLISAAALHPPVLALMVAIVAVRTFGLAKGVLRYLERLASHDAALRVLADLRVRVWNALVRLGPAVTERMRRGEVLNRLVSDVDAQQDLLVRGILPAASAALVGCGTAVALGLLVPSAGVATLFGLAVAGLAAPGLAILAGRAAERRTGTLRAAVLAGTVELLHAAPELVAFGAAKPRQTALAAIDDQLTAALRRSAAARGAGIGLCTLAIGATSIACTALGISAAAGVTLAVLALTPLAAADLVTGLPDAAQRLRGATAAARRIAELDHLPAGHTEPTAPLPLDGTGTLATHDLAVRWPDAPEDAVTGVTVGVGPSRRVALTGPSGAGKTTVLAAMMRNLDPASGQILADGTNTLLYTGDDVRAQIAWCGPDTHIFDSTLRENLRLASPDADDAALTAGLHAARLAPWLATLPDGLDTRLGHHGTGISGGERQRIGIARALIADRPILLLDEPTAHLDERTAAALTAELLDHTANKAALIVTHRPDDMTGIPTIRVNAHTAPASDAQPRAQVPGTKELSHP